jgi:hypothetical protein
MAVSCRLPTAETQVRSQVSFCEICSGQSGSETGFLRVLRFPLPILILPTLHTHQSSGDGTIGPPVAHVPSGLSPPLNDIQ